MNVRARTILPVLHVGPPRPEGRAEEVGQLLHGVLRALHEQYMRNAGGMAFADLRHHLPLVLVVTERPGVTVNELARVMRMPKSLVSVRITRLAERGIVRREADAHDSRLVRLRVTDEGCRHARDWQAAHHQALVRTLQPLSDAELAQIVGGLGLLLSALQRQGGSEGEGGMPGCSSGC